MKEAKHTERKKSNRNHCRGESNMKWQDNDHRHTSSKDRSRVVFVDMWMHKIAFERKETRRNNCMQSSDVKNNIRKPACLRAFCPMVISCGWRLRCLALDVCSNSAVLQCDSDFERMSARALSLSPSVRTSSLWSSSIVNPSSSAYSHTQYNKYTLRVEYIQELHLNMVHLLQEKPFLKKESKKNEKEFIVALFFDHISLKRGRTHDDRTHQASPYFSFSFPLFFVSKFSLPRIVLVFLFIHFFECIFVKFNAHCIYIKRMRIKALNILYSARSSFTQWKKADSFAIVCN